MPTNYDYKRLIGWIKRVSAAIVLFNVYEESGGGIKHLWSSPTLDIDLAATLTTTARTDALKVPLNFATDAIFNVRVTDASGVAVYFSCPDSADLAPSDTVAPLGQLDAGLVAQASMLTIKTSATGTIRARGSVATHDLYKVATLGFIWARRN
jgi:hypothetical protein